MEHSVRLFLHKSVENLTPFTGQIVITGFLAVRAIQNHGETSLAATEARIYYSRTIFRTATEKRPYLAPTVDFIPITRPAQGQDVAKDYYTMHSYL